MASAHGAGLMALPLVLPASPAGHVAELHSMHGMHGVSQMSAGPGLPGAALAATAAHAVGYLVVTGLLAVVVYERVGVRMLRSAWVNMDLLWAGALIVTAVLLRVLTVAWRETGSCGSAVRRPPALLARIVTRWR